MISEYVIQEISQGDANATAKRLAAIAGLAQLESQNEAILHLSQALLEAKALPLHAELDALHIAVCAFNRVEILASWNFTHIVNVHQLDLIEQICLDQGFRASRILTLDALT